MSKFKVEFILKQHTPIIHFQSEQSGATLRATELKPKFDRFLKKYAFNGNIPKEFKINDDKDALDYKVSLYGTKKQQSIVKKIHKRKNAKEIIDDGFPCFFATMGNEWEKSPKKFVYTDRLKINIICMNKELLNILKDNFSKFIFNTNFGTRQSKGFGSFSVISIDNEPSQTLAQEYLNFELDLNKIDNKIFSFVKYVENPDNYFIIQKKLFTIIDIFYKTLRSGINLSYGQKFYFKSLIYSYANSKEIVWDKKYFKQQFLGDKHKEILKQKEEHNHPKILHFSDIDKDKSFLVRDLLGLSTTQKWMSYKLRIRHPKEKGKDKLQGKSIKENNIKRFKSPMTIKPIQIEDNKFIIYIIPNDINKSIFKENFTILNSHDIGKGRGKKEIINNKIENLKLWSGFNLEDFFNYINNEINIDKYVDDKSKKHIYYELIKNIYTDIKAFA